MGTQLMLGNEAVARGLFEAGCSFVSSYPGTPSTEITKYAGGYVYAEWAVNEKVAAEAAVGASLAGARAFTGMKHVGLNVAADPLFTASYTGVGGGLVIAVADDMGCHSSQNEQDSRHYARAMKLPMLEPSDAQECLDFTKLAFELSEKFDTPVLLRLSTRVSHSRSPVVTGKPKTVKRREYKKDPQKWVMTPSGARPAHARVEERMVKLSDYTELTPVNTIEWGSSQKIGVIASGNAYLTAREALGDDVSFCKLGMVWPLPVEAVWELSETVDELWVIEELDDFIETHCRKYGVKVHGKSELSPLGEYGLAQIRQAVYGEAVSPAAEAEKPAPPEEQLPQRPPVLCPGCPHWGTFSVLKKLNLTVLGDIGCYTLAAGPPLGAMDFCVCMGASVSALHGFLKARPEAAASTVAVIGDSTFHHSGMTGLLNIVYNQTPATVLILDNAVTGMTGHQPNPGTGVPLKGDKAPVLDLEALCRGIGVERVSTVDPKDQNALEETLTAELNAGRPSVIIVRRECAIL